MKKVLWIDDDLFTNLEMLRIHLEFVNNHIEFHYAQSIGSSINYLKENSYELIILDNQLPPGFINDKKLEKEFYYEESGGFKLAKFIRQNKIGNLRIGTEATKICFFSISRVEEIKINEIGNAILINKDQIMEGEQFSNLIMELIED